MDGCRCTDDPGPAEPRDVLRAVPELIEDLVGLLAEQRRCRPDGAGRRCEVERDAGLADHPESWVLDLDRHPERRCFR